MGQFRNFHEGEAQLQAESGVNTQEFDEVVDQPFQPAFNPSEERFVAKRTFSVAASIDANGKPWSSPLVGHPGELFAVQDGTNLLIAPRPIDGDPLSENIQATGELGVLYFDPSRRRRAKSLGRATIQPDGRIAYEMTRNFGICTKYIFKRDHHIEGTTASPVDTSTTSALILSEADRAQLESADTLFLASHSDRFGADPTHRGGLSGFVTVVDDSTLTIPDYFGNGMFQTLGNLLLDDRIGLMTVDFVTGRTLQLTGRGSIRSTDDAQPQRTLVIRIEEVRRSWADIGAWTDVEPSEFNPTLTN